MALHNSIDLGASSKLDIIVDPVVVIPDILSKNESVIESSKEEKDKRQRTKYCNTQPRKSS